jgi:putative hydrolase
MLKIDLHTHTVASGHAFNTINEMAEEASRRGVEILAITDHGPEVSNLSLDFFRTGRRLPKMISGVKILFGCEANIINGNGDLDIDRDIQKNLDIVLVGLHEVEKYINLGREGNTQAIINAMKNPYVKIITHPYNIGNGYDVDIEQIAIAACESDILLEVNASYFYSTKRDPKKVYDRMKRMIAILKKNHKKVVINSDAHNMFEIGRDEEVREKFDYLGLTDDDILNYDIEETKKYFNIK